MASQFFPAAAAAAPLVKWVQQHGGFLHPALRLHFSPTSGVGLVPSCPIPAGTRLISLPRHLLLSLPFSDNVAPGSPDAVLLSLVQRVPEELWALRLSLKLLMEKARKDSFWWPYISNLPQSFNLPIFFSGEEIATLQYAPVIYQVKKRCRILLDLATIVQSVTGKSSPEQQPFRCQHVDANALGWAMAAASSRAFSVHSMSDDSQTLAGGERMLLPFIDMCNHSFKPNAHIVQQVKERQAFVMVISEENLESHIPIVLSYGTLNNDVLLLDYGFVVPQNPYDLVQLRFDGLFDAARVAAGLCSSAFTSPAPWQKAILEQLRLYGPGASLQVTVGGPDLVDGRLLAALRVLYAQEPEDLLNRNLNILQTWNSEASLGIVNDSNVLRTLVAVCAIALGNFPTTAMEDEKSLKNRELTDASRLAIQYRLVKKQLLVDSMKGFTRMLNRVGKVT